MNVHFNGDIAVIDERITLVKLLDNKQLTDKKGFAVAINENVISRNEWDKVILKENDRILVIKATQGG